MAASSSLPVSHATISLLILFESMYLCRRIISGCTAIVDDYSFFLFSCKRSCMGHCFFYHSLLFILEERMILRFFCWHCYCHLLITHYSHCSSSSSSSSEDPHFEPDFIASSLLTIYIHHYVLDESMISLHCLYQSFLSSSVS
jgi:hypothetical protein